MSKLDLDALQAEMAMAQQTGRKMCSVHVNDLHSLITRALELAKVQNMIPVPVGFCRPAELHQLIQAKRFMINQRRKKNDDFCIQVFAAYLPDGSKPKVDNDGIPV